MDRTIERLEKGWLKKDIPLFNVGDTVRIYNKVIEGEKERIQVFEGVVVGKKRGGHRESVTVRKVSYGVGVERVFPLHSPFVQQIQVVRSGRVRRSKLYYLRNLHGKAARLSERDTRSFDKAEKPQADDTAQSAEQPAEEQSQPSQEQASDETKA